MPRTTRILIVDDTALIRSALSRLLSDTPNFEIIGEAASGLDAIEMTGALAPDVVLMDVSMPKLNGIEATRRIAASYPQVRIIGLSLHEDGHMAKAMRDAGACDYTRKDSNAEMLVAAIRKSCDDQGRSER